MTVKKVEAPPVKFVGAPPAFQCKCPEKECSGWRASVSHGGGHVTHAQAMKLLEERRKWVET